MSKGRVNWWGVLGLVCVLGSALLMGAILTIAGVCIWQHWL